MLVLLVVFTVLAALSLVYWLFMSPYSQAFGHYTWRAKTTKKIVALTFDDGPNEPFTSQVLDILDTHSAKATFFLVGNCVRRFPDAVTRIFESGHVIGNHSVSHEFYRYFFTLSFKKQIEDNQAILQKHIGKTPALYRSPWLWRQPFLLATLRKKGLTPVSGEFCHALEPLQISGKRMAKAVLKMTKPGSIIIFHDGYDGKGGDRTQTVEAVRIVIEELSAQGYAFVTIDKLLGIPAYQ